jgi:exopolyphosphatase/guanosine-5'-triphosphate,3'-diphosphate pyrophosphatase
MVVAKIQPELPTFSIVDREKETVRLGNFHEDTKKLSEAAMQRAIDALKRCCAIATSLRGGRCGGRGDQCSARSQKWPGIY